jgi:hypothetical protein
MVSVVEGGEGLNGVRTITLCWVEWGRVINLHYVIYVERSGPRDNQRNCALVRQAKIGRDTQAGIQIHRQADRYTDRGSTGGTTDITNVQTDRLTTDKARRKERKEGRQIHTANNRRFTLKFC